MAADAQVLVWLADADAIDDALLALYAAWLGESEQARCVRFVRPGRRRQFIAGRALLRLALGRLLGCAPATIALRERHGQSPELLSDAAVGFSISHTGRWVACAAAPGMSLGLDIERIDRARDVVALAQQAFEAPDIATVLACAPETRHAAFYRLWCCHEARIKLGRPVVAEYGWEHDGLAGALACTAALAAAPIPILVQLDQLWTD